MTAPATALPVIVSALAPILQALAAAGLRVVEDPKDINPPCAYLAPPTLRFRFGLVGHLVSFRGTSRH